MKKERIMKKRATLLMGLLLTMTVAAVGCGAAGNADGDKTGQGSASGTGKTGIAVSTDISSSKDATEAEAGLAQADVSVAAVTVAADGKITSCVIDAVQAKVMFDGTGKLATDTNAEFPTKQELGDNYGMKKASAIKKEWNEQVNAFADYCLGKTAKEVTGIAVTQEGKAAEQDLAASCTIHITGLQALVAQAAENAMK